MHLSLVESKCHKYVQHHSAQFAPAETGPCVKWPLSEGYKRLVSDHLP